MKVHISFRVKHHWEDLEIFAASLSFPISRIWKAGENRKTTQGVCLEGVYQESYCVFKIPSSIPTITEAISVIRAELLAAPRLQPILKNLSYKKSLYCTLEAGGEILDLAALSSLVNLGIALEIDGG